MTINFKFNILCYTVKITNTELSSRSHYIYIVAQEEYTAIICFDDHAYIELEHAQSEYIDYAWVWPVYVTGNTPNLSRLKLRSL